MGHYGEIQLFGLFTNQDISEYLDYLIIQFFGRCDGDVQIIESQLYV